MIDLLILLIIIAGFAIIIINIVCEILSDYNDKIRRWWKE